MEAFNVFNHAQFYGPSSVDGEVNDPNFGSVVSALGSSGGEVSFLTPVIGRPQESNRFIAEPLAYRLELALSNEISNGIWQHDVEGVAPCC